MIREELKRSNSGWIIAILTIRTIKHAVIFLFFILSAFCVAAQKKSFKCPIKGGRIIKRPNTYGDMTAPGAEFYGKSKTVLNVLEGKVISFDTVFFKDSSNFYLRIYINSGDYFFSFHGLGKVYVKEGQFVKAKEKLGELKHTERLFLIMSYNGELVEPSKFLNCGIIRLPDL